MSEYLDFWHDAYLRYPPLQPLIPKMNRLQGLHKMFERFFETEFYKHVAKNAMTGVSDAKIARGLLKSLITALDVFFENSNAPIRLSWNAPADKPYHIESLLCYDCEDDRVLIVPVKVHRSLIDLGGKLIYLAQNRCAAMLAQALLNEIEIMRTGTVTA